MPHVYCDMDGVLVDLIKGFKDHCGYCITDVIHMHDEVVWKDALSVPKFWEILPKMEEADALASYIASRVPAHKRFVLSARMHLFEACDVEKTQWIHSNTPIFHRDNIKIVQRKEKQDFAVQEDSTPNILIDDYDKNIREWENAGGIGIHHVDLDTTLRKLSVYY